VSVSTSAKFVSSKPTPIMFKYT